MTYPISAGVYPREIDKSFVVPSSANSIGGIVITSDKGPTGELTLVTSNKQFTDKFGYPDPSNPSKYAALAYLESGTQLWVGRATNDAAAATLAVDDTQGTPVLAFTVNGANPGAWTNSISVATSASDANDVFTLTVSYGGSVVETFEVTRNPLYKDGFGKSMYIEDVVNGVSEYISIVDNTANPYTAADVETLTTTALTGGADDTTAPSDTNINTEWDRFASAETIEVSLLINGGLATSTVQTKMIAIAEARKDCFAILDFAAGTTTAAGCVTDVTTLAANTTYAAIYAGWLYVYDQYNDKYLYVPPSGYVAGAFASTANTSEVWYAPAGYNRGQLNVRGVQTVWTEGDRDTLYAANINPIQSFTGNDGIQIYGQKTLTDTPSALDRVNVRMLMISIQKSLTRSLRPFVFEFNDTFTRENITSIINSYLEDIKVRRGIYDYVVVCNESNNTAQIIDQNKMIVDVFVKPTRVAEFVQLNAVVSATGANFTSTI